MKIFRRNDQASGKTQVQHWCGFPDFFAPKLAPGMEFAVGTTTSNSRV